SYRELDALMHVFLDIRLELASDGVVIDDELRLVVDRETSDVHVCRSDAADGRINRHSLGVEVRALVEQHANARLCEVAGVVIPARYASCPSPPRGAIITQTVIPASAAAFITSARPASGIRKGDC